MYVYNYTLHMYTLYTGDNGTENICFLSKIGSYIYDYYTQKF